MAATWCSSSTSRVGRFQNISRANGVSSAYVYDSDGRLLTLTHSGGHGVNIPFAYSYDAARNRSLQGTSVGQPLITQAATNTFDRSNRLLMSGSTSYSYDANGNLISSTGTGGHVNERGYLGAWNDSGYFGWNFRHIYSKRSAGPAHHVHRSSKYWDS